MSQYDESASGTPGAQPAVVVDGFNAGKVVYVKLHTATAQTAQNAKEAREEREREDALRKEKAAREKNVRLAILEAVRAKAGGKLMKWEVGSLIRMVIDNADIPGAAALCAFRKIPVPGQTSNQPSADEDSLATDALLDSLHTLSEAEMFRLAIEIPITDELENYALVRNDPPAKLLELARFYKVDAAKIRASMEGGTRHEVEKPAAAKKALVKKAGRPAPKKTPAKKAAPVAKKAAPAKTKAAVQKTK